MRELSGRWAVGGAADVEGLPIYSSSFALQKKSGDRQ